MIEARVFVDSIDDAKITLSKEGAKNKGQYKIDDTIYRNKDSSISLQNEFLRLRSIPENIWNEKSIILAMKQTELHDIGKNSHVPLKLQFDARHEAENYYTERLKGDYVFDFSFSRIGWQYIMSNGDVVDLEIIEDKYPSIEFKSSTDDGIKKLLDLFAVNESDIMVGPSVVAIRERLDI